jgi:hypothetical protein
MDLCLSLSVTESRFIGLEKMCLTTILDLIDSSTHMLKSTLVWKAVLSFLGLLISILPTSLCAQPVEMVTSGKTKTLVRAGDGLINHYSGSSTISFQYKSFLTVKIGSKFYTNSDQPPVGAEPLPVGVQSREKDTVSVTWTLAGVRFVQRVFPQFTMNGRKIATQFLASKTDTAGVSVGCQYLLDVAISGSDGSPVLYREDYLKTESKKYVGDVPSYLILAENGLPNPPTYDPGILAMAIYRDKPHLTIDPSLLIVGHWPKLERIPYLTPEFVPPPSEPNMDRGILAQWPEQALTNDSLHVIGGFAYGVADFTVCLGWLFGLMFIPEEVSDEQLTPNEPLNVPFYVFNPDAVKEYKSTMTVSVEGALRLKGMQVYSNLATYPANGYRHFSLPLVLDTNSNSHAASVTMESAPLFFVDPCESSIELHRTWADEIDPSIENLTRLTIGDDCRSRIDSVLVTDETSGIASINLQLRGYRARYITNGQFPSITQTIELTVTDTLKNSDATIEATDRAGNLSRSHIEYCAIADTLAPQFFIAFNGKDAWNIVVTEIRPWDRLLSHVGDKEVVNTELWEVTNSSSEDSTLLNVAILEPSRPASMCIYAIDNAGNRADTCVHYAGPSNVLIDATSDLVLAPNPAKDLINISGGLGGEVIIHDLLGNIVRNLDWLSEKTISVKDLPSGRYFLIVGDRQISFSVVR